jgi:hypothetical protein
MPKKRIIIVSFLILWLMGILFAGWQLLKQNKKRNDLKSAVDYTQNGKRNISNEKILQDIINKGEFFYNTDADADIKYAQAVYHYQMNELKLLAGVTGAEEDKINKIIKSITKTTNSENLLGWVVYYDNPGGKYIASAEYNNKTKRWDIFVNLDMVQKNERETIITIIHEFAHIVSLNKEQMYSKIPQKICWTHFVPEGCLKKNSYLYKFWKNFWQGNYSEDELDEDGYAEKYYQKSPDKYVTEYSATNPAEDFAESFMYFITGDDYGDKKIAGKKVDFFRQYPEFRKAKNEILQNFKDILE